MSAMIDQFKKVKYLLLIPTVINTAVSVYCFFEKTAFQFQGYLAGTILSVVLSYIWIWQVQRGARSNTMVLLKLTFFGFLIKLLIFVVIVYSGFVILSYDKVYFAMAFLLGTISSVFIEIWFYFSIIKRPG
jgi:hypothetical protein